MAAGAPRTHDGRSADARWRCRAGHQRMAELTGMAVVSASHMVRTLGISGLRLKSGKNVRYKEDDYWINYFCHPTYALLKKKKHFERVVLCISINLNRTP